MFHEIAPFHSKSGVQAELPEDHCEEQETPEHKLHEEKKRAKPMKIDKSTDPQKSLLPEAQSIIHFSCAV